VPSYRSPLGEVLPLFICSGPNFPPTPFVVQVIFVPAGRFFLTPTLDKFCWHTYTFDPFFLPCTYVFPFLPFFVLPHQLICVLMGCRFPVSFQPCWPVFPVLEGHEYFVLRKTLGLRVLHLAGVLSPRLSTYRGVRPGRSAMTRHPNCLFVFFVFEDCSAGPCRPKRSPLVRYATQVILLPSSWPPGRIRKSKIGTPLQYNPRPRQVFPFVWVGYFFPLSAPTDSVR